MTNNRHEEIRLLLQEYGNLTVSELAKNFSVSEMTIRRDLKHLAALGLIQREHGRALYLESVPQDGLFLTRLGEAEREKTAIGIAAANLIEEGDSIILDAGTTTLAVAQAINKQCVVITNSLPIAGVLGDRPDITVLVTGGELRGSTYALVGPLTRSSLAGFNANRLFLGATGVDLERGLSTTNMQESEVKEAMLAVAKEVILVAHSNKIGKVFYHSFAHWDKVNILITDTGLSSEILTRIEELGVKVILV